MSRFKDSSHLFRVAFVFAAGVVSFAVVRAILVPRSFGEYGHYRGNAIQEIAAQPVSFAGHETCEACHTEVVEVKSPGKHAHVNCEACHGAQASHAENPTEIHPAKLDTKVLCARCHGANGARPKNFPQVVVQEHSGDLACDTCHQPHSPVISAGTKR